MSSLNVPRGIFHKIDWLVEKVKWLIYKVNSGGGGLNNVSEDGDPGTIAQRQENGALAVGNPVNGSDAVNLTTLNSMISGVNVVTGEVFTFGNTGYYTYVGDNNITVPLPDVEASVGRRYVILNTTGDGSLEITGNIYETGMEVSTFTITPGENYIIYSNGIHWVIV